MLIIISNRYIHRIHSLNGSKSHRLSPPTAGAKFWAPTNLRRRVAAVWRLASSSGGGYHLRTCGMPPTPPLGPTVSGRPRRCQPPAAGSRDRVAHDAGAGARSRTPYECWMGFLKRATRDEGVKMFLLRRWKL